MALQKNKVKFGLNKVHWAKITAWSDDGVPTFATPVRLPGAVSLSIDANGENENFYADNSVYYVINNNAGYDGDLEVALITTSRVFSVNAFSTSFAVTPPVVGRKIVRVISPRFSRSNKGRSTELCSVTVVITCEPFS